MCITPVRRSLFKGARLNWISLVLLSVALAVFLCSARVEARDLNLAWDPNTESDVAGYKVYYGTASRAYTSSADVGNKTSYTLAGLPDGTDYYVALTAYNTAGTESNYSTEVSTDPNFVPTSTPSSAPSTDSGGGGGGCFIATAAYGSYLAPEVRVLRDFRDNTLLTNRSGRMLVEMYYALSPPVANYIAKHETLRTLTRWYLTPMVYMVKFKFMLVIAITALMLPLLYSRVLRVQRRRTSA